MSGVVVTELRNAELGSIALMNDLFREIFAILLMYCLGWRYPRPAISAAGATAMDVTLPMVKQACGHDFIPHAMVSGFILSLLAPVTVSVLAAIQLFYRFLNLTKSLFYKEGPLLRVSSRNENLKTKHKQEGREG